MQGVPAGRPPLPDPAGARLAGAPLPGPPGNIHRPPLGTGADYGGEKLRRTPAEKQPQRRPATAGNEGLGTRTQRELQQRGGGDKLARTGAAQQPARENQQPAPPAQGRGGPAGPLSAAPAPAPGAGRQAPRPGAPPGALPGGAPGDLVSPNWQFRRVVTPRKIPRPVTAVRLARSPRAATVPCRRKRELTAPGARRSEGPASPPAALTRSAPVRPPPQPTQPVNQPGIPPLWSVNTLGEPLSNVLKRSKQARAPSAGSARRACSANASSLRLPSGRRYAPRSFPPRPYARELPGCGRVPSSAPLMGAVSMVRRQAAPELGVDPALYEKVLRLEKQMRLHLVAMARR